MGTPRSIEVLLSVFDLHVKTSKLNEGTSTRVLFTFDRKRGTREFRSVLTTQTRMNIFRPGWTG